MRTDMCQHERDCPPFTHADREAASRSLNGPSRAGASCATGSYCSRTRGELLPKGRSSRRTAPRRTDVSRTRSTPSPVSAAPAPATTSPA